MSAPSEIIIGETNVQEKVEIPDDLNLSSPNLNPLKVLYADNVYLPHKNPTIYNNLAEYENVVIKGIPHPSSRVGRGRAQRLSRQQPKPDNKDEPASDNEESEAVKLAKQRRLKLNRNVLTRMAGYEKGPLTLLRRAVEEHLRVKVWTRSAVTYRGYCKAFIIAFDKHFNLALMDVDETYRIPKARKKPIEKNDTEALCEKKPEITSQSESKDTESCVAQLTKRLSEKHLRDQDEDSKEQSKQLEIACPKLDIGLIKSEKSQSKDNIDNLDQVHNLKHCERVKDEPNSDVNDSHSSAADVCLMQGSSKVKTDSNPEVKVENSQESDDLDCQSEVEYITKHRHVNQLFVRGDNVVSIMLLE